MPPPDKKPEEILQDSVSAFRTNVLTRTPYTGPIGFYPGHGFIGYSTYRPAEIVIPTSDHPMADMKNDADLDELLRNTDLMATIFDLFATGSSTIQANDVFYWDEAAGKFAKTPKASSFKARPQAFNTASDMAKVGKTIGKAASWVSIAITATQVGRKGLNFHTGTDIVICAIGFIPYVGWVISGAYCIANVIVEEVTGKSISEHIEDTWHEKVIVPGARKLGMLEKYLFNVFFYDLMRWMY